tara:strand:- start:21770 stop:22582 length:813 start_codon:yes stop_codon:yes gene_type:complete
MIKNILLIRGLSREKSHWGTFPQLVESSLGLKVFCIDLPGMGEFNNLDSPIDLHQNTIFLRKKWEKLKADNPGEWIILGISLGGMVCLDWAACFNEDAKRFFVLNSSVKGVCKLFDRMSPYALIKMTKALSSAGPEQERHIFELTSVKNSEDKKSRDIINSWVKIREKRPISRTNFFRQLASAARYNLVRNEVKNVIFLAGKEDRLCSYRSSLALAKKFKAPVYVCETGAGHDFALDRPDFIIEHLKKELEQVGEFFYSLKEESTHTLRN